MEAAAVATMVMARVRTTGLFSPPPPAVSLPPPRTPMQPHLHPHPPTAQSERRKSAFTAALDGAFAAIAGGAAETGGGVTPMGGTGASGTSGGTRPTWLTHPTDDAGTPRPAGPYRPELFNAAAVSSLSGGRRGGGDAAAAAAFDPATLRIPPDALRALPPFTRQLWGIKSRLMDCVVMCRHGSFYNMFDVDAEVGIGVGLRLSGKPAAFMQKVGCFKDNFDEWAAKILGQGWSVARVEETTVWNLKP